VRKLDRGKSPPTSTSERASRVAAVARVRAEGSQRRFMLRERMAREVKAEDFLLHHELSFSGTGHIRSTELVVVRRIIAIAVKQATLAAFAIRQHSRAALHCPIDALSIVNACAQNIETHRL